MQLSIICIVNLLVTCCNYMQNAWYIPFQDSDRVHLY